MLQDNHVIYRGFLIEHSHLQLFIYRGEDGTGGRVGIIETFTNYDQVQVFIDDLIESEKSIEE